jgi:enamine deaminase RidA (YjgF/YER057c/UK114 family)
VVRVSERFLIGSGSPFEASYAFSRAVRAGNHVAVAGTAPIWPDGFCDPDPATQTRRCLAIIAAALDEAGSSLTDIVRTRMHIVDPEDQDAIGSAHAEVFRDIRPAATMVVVARLVDPRWKIEIEADALVAD